MSKILRKIRRGIASTVSAWWEIITETWLGTFASLKKIPGRIGDFFGDTAFGIRTGFKTLRRLPRRILRGTGDFIWSIADNLGVQVDSLKTLKRPFTLILDFFKYLFWAVTDGIQNLVTLLPRAPKLILRGIRNTVLFIVRLPLFLVTTAASGTVSGIKVIADGVAYLWETFVGSIRDAVSLPGQVVEQRRKILRRLTSRIAILGAAGLVIVGGGLAGIRYLALPAYQEFKQERLITQAREFLEDDDIRGAILTTHQILRTNYNNLGANRLMAEIGERIGTDDSLNYRERVSALDPEDHENRILWAAQAARMNRYESARRAMEGMPAEQANDPRVLWARFQMASGEGEAEEARGALRELLRVEPGHSQASLELLLTDLSSNNVVVSERARLELGEIARDEEDPRHARARRELILDDLRQGLMIEAIPLAQRIRDNPESSYFDRLLALTTLRRTGFRVDYADYLRELQEEAHDDPRKAFMMAELMMRNRDHVPLVEWSQSFSSEVRNTQGVQFHVSEALLQSRRWQQLEQYLRPLDWREGNFRRHAKLARAFREQERAGSFETEWRLAVVSVRTVRQMRELLEMTRDWGWVQETESLIWTAMDRFPNEDWPAQEIFNEALESGRSDSLTRILEEMVRRNPTDIFARNDLTRLLLLQHRRVEEAHATALRLYSQNQDNLRITLTYALSLHMQDRTEEAVALFEEMPPERIRESPPAQLYYGLFLAFSGNHAEANDYLDNLPADLDLLPEERRLLREAREQQVSSDN